METKTLNRLDRARLTANKIASTYLERFPRELSYEVQTCDDGASDRLSFCITLSEDKVDAIRKCYKIAKENGASFCEILKTEIPELEAEILSHDKGAQLVESVDIDNPLAFTEFSFYQINKKGQIGFQGVKSIVLTDDLFKALLVELMIHQNKYTTNMMAYEHPELAKDVIYKLDNAVYNWISTNTDPTAYDFCQLKQICDSILNPFKDILHLFDSEDKELRRFAHSHQVVPEEDAFFFDSKDEIRRVFGIYYKGTKVVFWKNILYVPNIKGIERDDFSVDANAVIKKFGLKSPEDIFAYLKDNYSSVNGYERLKKEFGVI